MASRPAVRGKRRHSIGCGTDDEIAFIAEHASDAVRRHRIDVRRARRAVVR
jgi:hypothetical protein